MHARSEQLTVQFLCSAIFSY